MGTYLSPLQRISRIVVFIKNYLESGFLDLLSTGQCTADAYRPATLNYNAAVTAYLAAQDTPLQGAVTIDEINTALTEYPFTGETIADGAESKSVGCASKQLEITVGAPCDTTYTGGNFCDLGILVKKQAMKSVPGSMFTGKTRLFVQAVYGANREDYSHSGLTLTLDDGQGHNYTLNPMGVDGNSWLLSLIDGNYALVKKSGASLIVTPLLLTSDAQQFASILSTHPDKNIFAFSSRVEAYILAYAKPDTGNEISVSITGSSVIGDPLSYGWHTNWAGDEAHIVTFYADAANNRFISNQYLLTISQNVVAGEIVISASITTVEANKPWVNWGTSQPLHLFYYDELAQEMMPVPKPSGTPPEPFTHDAPVYCVTKLNTTIGDCELIVLRAYRQTIALSNTFHSDYSKLIDQDRFAEERTFRSGSGGDSGFKSTGAIVASWVGENDNISSSNKLNFYYLATVPSGGEWTWQSTWDNNNNWKMDNGYNLLESNKYYNDSSTPILYARTYSDAIRFRAISESLGQTVKDSSSFLEAPFGFCDSFIVGVTTQIVQQQSSVSDQTGRYVWDDYLYAADATYNPVGPKLFSFSSTGGQLYVRGWNALNTAFQVIESSTSTNTPAGTYYSTSIYDCSSSEGAVKVVDSSLQGDSRYFYPTLSDPGTGTIDTALSSIQSGAKSNHTLYTQDYGFIKDASVGWA